MNNSVLVIGLLIGVVGLTIGVWTLLKKRPHMTTLSPKIRSSDQTRRQAIKQGKFIGLKFNWFQWNFYVRPAISLLGALVIVMTFVIFDNLIIETDIINWLVGSGLFLLFAISIGAPDSDETVPAAHAAMLTFGGMRLRIYRTEGIYKWTGRRFFLGRYSLDPTETSEHMIGTNPDGFINLGEIPIEIWDRSDTKDEKTMQLIASTQTTILGNLILVIQILDPYAWTSSDDPLLDIAERARSAFRAAVSFFTAIDNSLLKSVLGSLMSGVTIITSLLPKVHASYPEGTIVRDRSGIPLYDTLVLDEQIDKNVRTARIKEAMEKFQAGLETRADPEMLKEIKNNGTAEVVCREVEDHLEDVVESVGATLIRASVGTIILPPKIQDEAALAESENRQRVRQVASAKTFAVSKKIMDDARTPGDEFAAAVAAAQDIPEAVKIVHISGSNSDRLTRAAVAGASQINMNGGK